MGSCKNSREEVPASWDQIRFNDAEWLIDIQDKITGNTYKQPHKQRKCINFDANSELFRNCVMTSSGLCRDLFSLSRWDRWPVRPKVTRPSRGHSQPRDYGTNAQAPALARRIDRQIDRDRQADVNHVIRAYIMYTCDATCNNLRYNLAWRHSMPN